MSNLFSIMNGNRLSIVIATLGGESLTHTLECINRSSFLAYEVLICVPDFAKKRVLEFNTGNQRVLVTKYKGQVSQRSEGFLSAKGDYVLQIDDDVRFDENAIQELMKVLQSLGPGNVVGPVFYDITTGNSLANYSNGISELIKNIYFKLICDLPWGRRRLGKFSKCTCSVSIDPHISNGKVEEVEWLAGGFVLSKIDDLIMNNFYNYSGKAYCEDILHSWEREKRGIKHYVASGIKISISNPQSEIELKELPEMLSRRWAIGRKLGASLPRLSFFLFFESLRIALKSITRKN